jgi:23S rRNA pseudouridine1911/1915/1917 synthase
VKQISLISDADGIRLDVWLSSKLENASRSYIQKIIANSGVTVNGKTSKSNYRLRAGDIVSVDMPEPEVLDIKAEKIELEILFEDQHIIVVNKPKGMVVHPAAGNYSGTLVNALMEYCGSRLSDINGIIRPGIVHRIDKDTSGVLVVAKNNIAHEKLSSMLKKHDIKRVYNAVVSGVVKADRGKIDAPVSRHHTERKKMAVNAKSGRRAVTHFRVVERFRDATFLELELETGRTHQIRVHMAFIGHPVVGDEVYGFRKSRFSIKGQALHARILGFRHPATGEYMEFEAGLPQYFSRLLEELREETAQAGIRNTGKNKKPTEI